MHKKIILFIFLTKQSFAIPLPKKLYIFVWKNNSRKLMMDCYNLEGKKTVQNNEKNCALYCILRVDKILYTYIYACLYMFHRIYQQNVILFRKRNHQWPSGFVLKIGRWEMPGSVPGCACRPSRSEFSVVFSEIYVNSC